MIDEKLLENSQKSLKIEEISKVNSENLLTLTNDINTVSEGIGNGIDGLVTPLKESINIEIEKLSTELSSVKDTYTKMKEMFDKLQKSIMDLRNL